MAKKKKTRQDKIKADFRHELPGASFYVVSQPTEKKIAQATPQTVSLNTYFLKDLKKTGILTISVLAGQIALYILLKNQVIRFPFVTY